MKNARFRLTSEMEGGAYHRFQTATCSCGFEEQIRDTTRNGAPPEMMRRKFQQRGWAMGSRAADDECPPCVKKRTLTPAQKQAAFLRINGPRPKAPKPETIMPDAPRQPSTDDKRRIREALFTHYDEAKGCYSAAHTDRSVAKALDVPFAWVTATREALGFGPDKNEAQGQFTADVLALRAVMKAAEDDFLTKFGELEKRLAAVERAGLRTAA